MSEILLVANHVYSLCEGSASRPVADSVTEDGKDVKTGCVEVLCCAGSRLLVYVSRHQLLLLSVNREMH